MGANGGAFIEEEAHDVTAFGDVAVENSVERIRVSGPRACREEDFVDVGTTTAS